MSRRKMIWGSMVLLLSLVLAVLPARAEESTEQTYNEWKYTQDQASQEITITGYTGTTAAVTVPDSINGSPVTTIGQAVFKDKADIENIALPESIISIDYAAFKGCKNLKNINLPQGIELIGSDAFDGCKNLQAITLPDSLTSIKEGAFRGCSGLTAVTVPEKVTVLSTSTFSNCTGLASVSLPDTMTAIRYWAFLNCENLTQIRIPDSITKIENATFEYCEKLSKIVLPSGLVSIEYNAFRDCKALAEIDFPKSLTSIGADAFSGTAWLSQRQGKVNNPFVVAGNILIDGTGCTGDVTVPDSVKRIADNAFKGCTGITSLIVPSGVQTISAKAFEGCEKLPVIYGDKGSAAEAWASQKGCTFYTAVQCFFDANGGKTDEAKRDVFPGLPYRQLPTPKREHYNFTGWYTRKDGGDKINENTPVPVEQDHTLYARWKTITNTNPEPDTTPGGKTPEGSTPDHPAQPRVQTITALSKTVVYGSKAFSLKAKASGGGRLTYKSSNTKVAKVSQAGKVTVKSIGKATITIKAAAVGDYPKASKKITVKVVPKTPKLKKVNSPGRKMLSASWTKDKNASGYEVQLCLKKHFKAGALGKNFKKSDSSMKITGLKSKKNYYVRLRSYRKVGKTKYYSAWSKAKKMKIK